MYIERCEHADVTNRRSREQIYRGFLEARDLSGADRDKISFYEAAFALAFYKSRWKSKNEFVCSLHQVILYRYSVW